MILWIFSMAEPDGAPVDLLVVLGVAATFEL